MARRRSDWDSADHRSAHLGTFFQAGRDEAKVRFGDERVLTGDESEKLVIGLPFPKGAFCLRWLFCSTVWPLMRIMQIVGEEGSCKSALLYEIFRWFWWWGGGSYLFEAEDKDSPDLRHSIVGDEAIGDITVHKCEHIEDWQEGLQFQMERDKKRCEVKGGPGRTIPICYGIDSLVGRTTRDTAGSVEEKGYATRSYPTEALSIAQYMRVMPKWLPGWPFCVVGTNHLKPDTASVGFIPTKRSPGGTSLKFQETFEIVMKRTGDIELADRAGLKINLSTKKNSLGPSRRDIGVNVYWQYQVVDGNMKQHTWWDWGGATVDLLLAYSDGKSAVAKSVREIVDLDPTRNSRVVASKTLGIPGSAPVPYAEAAERLDENQAVLQQLYNLFGIRQRREFQPSRDYRDQLEELRRSIQPAAADDAVPASEDVGHSEDS